MCGINTFDNQVGDMKLCICISSTFQNLTVAPLLKALPSIAGPSRSVCWALTLRTSMQASSQYSPLESPSTGRDVSDSHRRGCHSLPPVGPWDSVSVVMSALFPIELCSGQDLNTSHPSTPVLSESPGHTAHSCQRLPSAEYLRFRNKVRRGDQRWLMHCQRCQDSPTAEELEGSSGSQHSEL